MDDAADVLQEDAPSAGLDDEPASGGPKVALVLGAKARACFAVRLARDAAKDEVHASTKRAAWSGSGI
jgi:hypothetical protein